MRVLSFLSTAAGTYVIVLAARDEVCEVLEDTLRDHFELVPDHTAWDRILAGGP